MPTIRRLQFRIDLISIATELAEVDEELSFRFIDRVNEAVSLIERLPGIGEPSRISNPLWKGVRRHFIKRFRKYVLYYRELDEGIELLRLVHGRRNPNEILGEDDN